MFNNPVFPSIVNSDQLGFAELTTPIFPQSSISAPGIAVITAPEELDELTVDTSTVEWGAVNRARTYEIQIAEDEEFNTIFEQANDLEVLEYENAIPFIDGDYYVRVRAINVYGAGAWSETVHFTVALP